MSKKLKALIEQRSTALREMKAVVAKAEEGDKTRALTTDEQKEFDTLETQVNDLNATISRIKALEGAEQEEVAGDEEERDEEDGDVETEKQRAIREQKEEADFADFVRSAANGRTQDTERALDLGSNGAIVPKTVVNKIIARVYDISPVVEKANVYRTKGTVSIPQYGADANASNDDLAMAYAAEFTDLTAHQGAFGSVDLGSFLAGALAKVSNSLINNTDIDVVAKVVELMAQTVARFLEKEILIGTASKANGLLSLPTSQKVTAASATAIAADELIDLRNKVKGIFRTDGFYVFHQDTITKIEKMKDANNQYLFNTNNAEGPWAGTVGGYKVYASDAFPSTLAAGVVAGVFVNPGAALAVRLSPDVEIQVLRELYAAQHATGVVAWIDFDTDVENFQAVAQLKMAAS